VKFGVLSGGSSLWNYRLSRALDSDVGLLKVYSSAYCFHVSGPIGENQVWFNACEIIHVNKDLFAFGSKKAFGSFIGLLYSAMFGVLYGFRAELELRGLGYRGFVGNGCLFLDVGDCHWIVCPIPYKLEVRFQSRYHILFKSCDYGVLKLFLDRLQRLKSVNIYTGMGLRVDNAVYRVKVGKVKDR
jgi:ribosomal protein L6P/L9E